MMRWTDDAEWMTESAIDRLSERMTEMAIERYVTRPDDAEDPEDIASRARDAGERRRRRWEDDAAMCATGWECPWPPTIETARIPAFARELRRGWVWKMMENDGDAENGPDPNAYPVRVTLPRALVTSVEVRTLRGERVTFVTAPDHVFGERGLQSIEQLERERQDAYRW